MFRLHHHDPLYFRGKLELVWRDGGMTRPSDRTRKCLLRSGGVGEGAVVDLTVDAWLFTWEQPAAAGEHPREEQMPRRRAKSDDGEPAGGGPPLTSWAPELQPPRSSGSVVQAAAGAVRIDVDCNESEMLPSPNASLRQATGIAWGNRTWLYGDFIPFSAIKYPASYNTTIHAFSSSDGCRGCALATLFVS